MAKYTGADTVIEYDNSGGTLVNISQHVLSISNPAVEAAFEESHTFGDSWKEQLPAGLKMVPDITITGHYDDTATTGPDALMGYANVGATTTREFKVTFGGSKTFLVNTYLKKWEPGPKRGGLTTYTAVLTATGAVTAA
jgi:hypothetical protein